MKISTFLVIKAVVCFIFAIGYLLLPATVGSMYAINLDPDGILMSRFFAALLVGIGLMLWLLKDAEWNLLKVITLSLFVADTLGFVIALVAQLSGVMNGLGWIIVIIWLLLAAGLGYLRFVKQGNS